MDPPPASLEAMVRNGPRSPLAGARGPRLLWGALVIGVAVAAYLLGLRH